MPKVFKEMTEGDAADGQGDCVFVAGTVVTTIKRVYKKMPADEWTADIIAPGYQIGGTHGIKDKVEEPVEASVPLASIVVAS